MEERESFTDMQKGQIKWKPQLIELVQPYTYTHQKEILKLFFKKKKKKNTMDPNIWNLRFPTPSSFFFSFAHIKVNYKFWDKNLPWIHSQKK